MKILIPGKEDFSSIISFVSQYESSCVQLCSYIRKFSSDVYVLSTTEEITNSSILGVLYANSSVFHCIPKEKFSLIDKDYLHNFLYSLSKPVKCISGESIGSNFLISVLKAKPYQQNVYQLMSASSIHNPPEPLYNDDQIIRCTVNDFESLLPIQKMYMQEEVAPVGKEISDAEVCLSLRQILKNQLCVALLSDGELVAKANTNAIGFNWIQLGGVFTHPLFRRNNYAWHIISAICRRVFSSGKSICLFVKISNLPAISLYKTLGFSCNGEFLISYFK